MKQYTTPTLAVKVDSMEAILSSATQVVVTLRRGPVSFEVTPTVEGTTVYVPLSEEQTGALCSGPKGYADLEVSVVSSGVCKTETVRIPVEPSVRWATIGYSGSGSDDEGTVFDAALVGELFESSYVLPAATASSLGGVKIGDGLSVTEDGTLSSDAGEQYVLPVATTSSLGGVVVGDGLSVTAGGTLSADVAEQYVLPVATDSVLGGVKVGSGLSVEADGTLAADVTEQYVLPAATSDSLGGIKAGDGISVSDDGTATCITEARVQALIGSAVTDALEASY